jgi:hypothetical protein
MAIWLVAFLLGVVGTAIATPFIIAYVRDLEEQGRLRDIAKARPGNKKNQGLPICKICKTVIPPGILTHERTTLASWGQWDIDLTNLPLGFIEQYSSLKATLPTTIDGNVFIVPMVYWIVQRDKAIGFAAYALVTRHTCARELSTSYNFVTHQSTEWVGSTSPDKTIFIIGGEIWCLGTIEVSDLMLRVGVNPYTHLLIIGQSQVGKTTFSNLFGSSQPTGDGSISTTTLCTHNLDHHIVIHDTLGWFDTRSKTNVDVYKQQVSSCLAKPFASILGMVILIRNTRTPEHEFKTRALEQLAGSYHKDGNDYILLTWDGLDFSIATWELVDQTGVKTPISFRHKNRLPTIDEIANVYPAFTIEYLAHYRPSDSIEVDYVTRLLTNCISIDKTLARQLTIELKQVEIMSNVGVDDPTIAVAQEQDALTLAQEWIDAAPGSSLTALHEWANTSTTISHWASGMLLSPPIDQQIKAKSLALASSEKEVAMINQAGMFNPYKPVEHNTGYCPIFGCYFYPEWTANSRDIDLLCPKHMECTGSELAILDASTLGHKIPFDSFATMDLSFTYGDKTLEKKIFYGTSYGALCHWSYKTEDNPQIKAWWASELKDKFTKINCVGYWNKRSGPPKPNIEPTLRAQTGPFVDDCDTDDED